MYRYKESEVQRQNQIYETMQKLKENKQAALQALPSRLAFAARVSHPPQWQPAMKLSKLNEEGASEVDRMFPPSYDPSNVSTYPAYVRSLLDYEWTSDMTPQQMLLPSLLSRKSRKSEKKSQEEMSMQHSEQQMQMKEDSSLRGYGQETQAVNISAITRAGGMHACIHA